MEWTVSIEDQGLSLRKFLKQKLNKQYSSAQVNRAIDRGLCRINNTIQLHGSTLLRREERVDLTLPNSSAPTAFESNRILYEDPDILCYDKPAGIASDKKGILKLLGSHYRQIYLAHRLDKETTGALLLAKNPAVLRNLEESFRNRSVRKRYTALIDGVIEKKHGTIEAKIGITASKDGGIIRGTTPKGAAAKTAWTTLKKGRNASLLNCFPETGRTHQIRIHMASIGHPILGDARYARSFLCAYRAERYFLHAAQIDFPHPSNGSLLTVKAPIPQDMEVAIQSLFQ